MPSEALTRIPLSVPEIGGNEWAYVKECLDTGWVSSAGPFVDRFEREFAAKLGVKHAVACSSGTAALHVALLCAGVKPGDLVVTSTLTFIATVNSIVYCGAQPVLIDADPASRQMDVTLAAGYLENQCERRDEGLFEKASGRRVAAVVPVHILGCPVDMDPLMTVCDRLGVPVVEDATESLGATYRGKNVGTHGVSSCFSFNGNKLLTTGGGGMIATDCDEAARRAKHLTTQAKIDEVEFVHDEVGFNYRLPNVAAAIGVAQLERLDEYVAKKKEIARLYHDALVRDGTVDLTPPADAEPCHWLYTLRFGQHSSRELMKALSSCGIQTRPLWQPIHRSPAHEGLHGSFPVADSLNRSCLSLPCSVGLGRYDQERVIATIRSIM